MRPTVPKSHRESERRSLTGGFISSASLCSELGVHVWQYAGSPQYFPYDGMPCSCEMMKWNGEQFYQSHKEITTYQIGALKLIADTQENDRGVEKLVSHENHSLETVGSNPAAATTTSQGA